MPAGVIIRNDSGNIQFTDSFKSYVLVQKGTVTLGAPEVINTVGGTYTTGNMVKVSVPNNSNRCPLLAVICTATQVGVYKAILNGSNWDFYICAQQSSSYSGTSVDYFVFDMCPDTVAATSGLKIFDAAGKCQYHSSLLPLRITDFQKSSSSSAGNFSLPSGRKLAIIPLVMGYTNTSPLPAGTWTTYFTIIGVQMSNANTGSTGGFQYMMHQNSINIGSGSGSGAWAAFAIDVTNY